MRPHLLAAITGVVVATAGARAQSAVRPAVASACRAIEALAYHDFAYGRCDDAWGWSPGHRELADVLALAPPIAELEAMLRDADPKVRTLALLLLFDREEHELLPRLAAFASDGAGTFPAATRVLGAIEGESRWHDEPMTVGGVAQLLLGMWYRASGQQRVDEDPVRAFDTWWQTHRQHRRGAAWSRLRLTRATGGCGGAIPQPWQARAARVRAAVDEMPSPDRELLVIALPDLDSGPGACFASDADRVAAAKRLGDEVLLQCLAGDFPSDDPCWQQWFCQGGVFGTGSALHRFLLSPQHRIFAASSAPRLLELEAEQRRLAKDTTGFVDAGWVATAASLQPQHGTEWVVAALDRFGAPFEFFQRSQLLCALAQFGDAKSEAVVVEHLWRDDLAPFGTQARTDIVRSLADAPPARARALLAAIVASPGFQDSDPMTTGAIAKAAGVVLGKEAVPDSEIRGQWHPLGLDRLATKAQRDAAAKQHPAETERVLATTKQWRKAIVKALQ